MRIADDAAFLYWMILSCEIAFWAVLALALSVRYIGRAEKASRPLLFLLPALDLLLLVVTVLDLRAGTPATFAHGLAIAYLGFTVAFGPVIVRWADAWFASRFAGGPPPQRMATRGWPAVRDDLMLWLRCIAAWAITLLLLGASISYLDDAAVTDPLLVWYRIAFGSTAVWFLLGPMWSLAFLSWRRPGDA